MFEGKFEIMNVNRRAKSGGIIGIFVSIFFNLKVMLCPY